MSLRKDRISPSCTEVIRSTAYICGIYCHSVRTLRGVPTSPRRGLFATSSAIPGIVEGVHRCAAAIPCAPRRYPLSAFEHTYTKTHVRVHTKMRLTFLLFVVATAECAVAVYRRFPYSTHTHTCTRVRVSSLSAVHDRGEVPSTDTTTANIEFALTSREHVGRSIRLVWYPRNFTGGYEGKLNARRRLFSRTRAAFYPLAV